MVLADFFGLERNHWDTKILATDISTKVLKQAVAEKNCVHFPFKRKRMHKVKLAEQHFFF